MIEGISVPHRSHSPLVIVNALALTIAALFAAWDVVCHDHDAAAASNAWSAIDRNVEAAGATDHASLGAAAAPHEHSCVACRLGCSKKAEVGRSSVATNLDLVSTAARLANDGSARRGESRPQAARGPPPA